MFDRFMLVALAACGSSSSSTDAGLAADVEACQAVGSAYCARAYACLGSADLAAYGLPATQPECVAQENANCGSASPQPGFCKGNPQTSTSAATACAAELNGLTCSDFTSGSASGSDVCKTELCAS